MPAASIQGCIATGSDEPRPSLSQINLKIAYLIKQNYPQRQVDPCQCSLTVYSSPGS